ncbi:Transcriptional regulator, LuxR family [Labilithrix luteola]|uniref:Transcriptional regulator, LuxR family n=1 Tax=Labilithrix luteola TaxID=1391654 RepID=A0A0K1QBI2_9BACT|nr:helix-turn-helix transcriptional regulator [Labilithrix luteola]AKV03027.1 Transcriptional regulator, LuxR family [Labilithrix luteola]
MSLGFSKAHLPDGAIVGDIAMALRTVLEAVPGGVFVLNSDAHVFQANASGRRLLAAGFDVRAAMRTARKGASATVSIRPFAIPGLGPQTLLVVTPPAKPGRRDTEARVAYASNVWELTRRQAEVLSLVVHGHANRAIAERLSCAVRTVEVHISSLLMKASVDSRAGLVARFWTFGLEGPEDDTPPQA